MAEDQGNLENRIDINRTGVGYDLVPSDPDLKSQGWQNLFAGLPEFVSLRKKGSAGLLLRIHETMTPGIRELPVAVLEDMESSLYVLDRPDGDAIDEKFFDEKFEVVMKQAQEDKVTIPKYMKRMKSAYRETALTNSHTTINLNPQISGKLRSYGTRKIEGFPQEEVYASHVNVMAGDAELFVYALSASPNLWPPKSYYGLSVGLPQVYEALCARYDEMADLGGQDALLREAFFQLVGTRVLHPFWDANGRAFGGFLAVALKDQDVDANPNQIQDGIEQLTSINDQMLYELLTNSNLAYVTGELHLAMYINHSMRQDYMSKLRAGIDKAIDNGINSNGTYFPLIERAAKIIEEIALVTPTPK